MAFSVGAAVVGGLVWLFTLHPPSLPNPLDWLEGKLSLPGAEPVVVLVVGSPENVEVMRGVVDAKRILTSSPEGFALDGGRVVSARVEDAGTPLAAAGWIDRPVEIVAAPRHRLEVTRAPGSEEPGEGGPAGGSMSRAEALLLLDDLER